MLYQPIQSAFEKAQRVLIAGAGGGFDFLCGLPLFFALEARGCHVQMANLSFTPLQAVQGATWHSESLLEVDAGSHGPDYFPERWLSSWFNERLGRKVPLWCFGATGVVPYSQNYAYLVERERIDTVLVIDGGVDSLLRGDEHSLGTPLWDALTVAAVNNLNVPRKLLATVAFGAERWDKISHAQALERIADLTRDDALLGVTTLLSATAEGAHFVDAANYIFDHQRNVRQSVVVSSLLSALRGEFGERAVNAYTEMTPLWVSPLMCLFWFFDLEVVARHKLFLEHLMQTQTLGEAADRLHEFTQSQPPKHWETIPI
jgi:hypothetical protein